MGGPMSGFADGLGTRSVSDSELDATLGAATDEIYAAFTAEH